MPPRAHTEINSFVRSRSPQADTYVPASLPGASVLIRKGFAYTGLPPRLDVHTYTRSAGQLAFGRRARRLDYATCDAQLAALNIEREAAEHPVRAREVVRSPSGPPGLDASVIECDNLSRQTRRIYYRCVYAKAYIPLSSITSSTERPRNRDLAVVPTDCHLGLEPTNESLNMAYLGLICGTNGAG